MELQTLADIGEFMGGSRGYSDLSGVADPQQYAIAAVGKLCAVTRAHGVHASPSCR